MPESFCPGALLFVAGIGFLLLPQLFGILDELRIVIVQHQREYSLFYHLLHPRKESFAPDAMNIHDATLLGYLLGLGLTIIGFMVLVQKVEPIFGGIAYGGSIIIPAVSLFLLIRVSQLQNFEYQQPLFWGILVLALLIFFYALSKVDSSYQSGIGICGGGTMLIFVLLYQSYQMEQ